MASLRLAHHALRTSPLTRPRISLSSTRSVSSSSQGASSSSLWRTGLYTTVFVVSTGLFAVYYFDSRSAIHRYVLTPLLRYTLDPEAGHKLAVKVIGSGLAPKDTQPDDANLKVELWGLELDNPVGLAAGFDKNGEAVDGLFDLGFSWVEIGSVTPKPQPGNQPPRVFHLTSDSALINRYGFPSEGHVAVLSRLRSRIPSFSENDNIPASLRPGALLAVNLGKNKSSPPDSISDFLDGVKTFGPYADVLVINVSSPNTPGLRGLQSRALLEELLAGVTQTRNSLAVERKPKLVLKIAPDLEESAVTDIATVIRENGVDGVIVSNTTIQRPEGLRDPNKLEAGGLSGPPLKPYTLATLRTLRAYLPASVPIIGCGGISSGSDALEYAKAGATSVQVYTSFGYDGAGACRRIKDELADELRKANTTWADVVRKACAELSLKEAPPAPAVREEKGSVGQLIEEAKELEKLIDKLGERFESEVDTLGSEIAAVTPTVA